MALEKKYSRSEKCTEDSCKRKKRDRQKTRQLSKENKKQSPTRHERNDQIMAQLSRGEERGPSKQCGLKEKSEEAVW